MDTRIREAVELHADTGLRLSGIAVRYGDIAGPPRLRFRERIEPGAFGNLSGVDVRLNRQHDRGRLLARTNGGGLELHDSPDALRFTVQLPDTADARDVHTLVRSGVMRGASIEYDALRERQSGGVSVVERARLSGLAIVDSGAYADSLVEARAEIRQAGRGIEGSFYYDVDRVTSDRESMEPDSLRLRASRKTRVSPGAFAYTLRDPEREVQLLMGPDFGQPLASVQAGTLQLEDVAGGAQLHSGDTARDELCRGLYGRRSQLEPPCLACNRSTVSRRRTWYRTPLLSYRSRGIRALRLR